MALQVAEPFHPPASWSSLQGGRICVIPILAGAMFVLLTTCAITWDLTLNAAICISCKLPAGLVVIWTLLLQDLCLVAMCAIMLTIPCMRAFCLSRMSLFGKL